MLDYEDKTELKETDSLGVDWQYEEVFWSKRHYPALEIAYLAVREDLRGSDIGSFLINSIAEMAAYHKNHFESCELPNASKDTLRMYRALYLN